MTGAGSTCPVGGFVFDEQPQSGQMPSQTPEPVPLRAGPRMPGRRDVTITMPGDYGDAGFRLKVWANYPHRLANDISSGDEDRQSAALSQIVLEHNGWLDEDGEPVPQLRPAKMSAREGDDDFEAARQAFQTFWEAIPQELALAISTSIGLEVSKLMTSVANRRRR